MRLSERNDNRIRSPRWVAFGFQEKVGKGSRQIGSVTSGEGLALKVEYRDACSIFGWDEDAADLSVCGFWLAILLGSSVHTVYSFTKNDQFRTVTISANLTV